MTTQILFKGGPNSWQDYEIPLSNALQKTGLEYHLAEDISPEQVDYIVYAPSSGLSDFKPYTRCKAVLCLWAGVETIIGNKSLTMPLTRMVDSGMTQGMVEWVTGHVLRHHLGTARWSLAQRHTTFGQGSHSYYFRPWRFGRRLRNHAGGVGVFGSRMESETKNH